MASEITGARAARATAASSSERISATLKEEILSGALRPGARIRLDGLAERFGTSRLPVRDALRDLVTDGLVTLEPYRGARVVDIDDEEINELYMLRMLVEPHALEQSAPHLTDEQLARLSELLGLMQETQDAADYLELDKEFHMVSYSGAHRMLRELCERFWNSTERYRRILIAQWAPEQYEVLNAEHALMLEALQRGDGSSAGHHLIAHYRRPQQWFNSNRHLVANEKPSKGRPSK